ncbi:MAG: hypothetical protein AAGA05_01755 [Pseudomonadota bacterium]
MVTKTERILDLLPGTFAAQPAQSPLQTLVATYGGELQRAENTLAAILRAHWCTQADLGREMFDDLPRIAALYGLAPQPGDDIEEFRRRLKLWVRLILEGPSTVRGLLRAASIITGLEIDDSDEGFDAWWTRGTDRILTTSSANRRDAGRTMFGFDRGVSNGADAMPARISGTVLLPDVLAPGARLLHLSLDGGAPVVVDLSGAGDPDAIVEAINSEVGPGIASITGGRLHLTSPSTGPASQLRVEDGPDDAARDLLGLPPRTYAGAEATAARVTGLVDLAGGADLSDHRYLRLLVDGSILAEIDCAGTTPASTSLDEVVDAINTGLGLSIASHDGSVLTLASPNLGAVSSITFQTPAAQDARLALFGPVPSAVAGRDAQPSRITGTPNLASGVDLSSGGRLVLAIDADGEVEVDCTGADPENTQLPEIIALINDALGADVARTNGANLVLSGIATGAAGQLRIGQAETGDAARALLGLADRTATGSAASRAVLRGIKVLSGGVNLAARPLLQIAQDGRPPRVFDLSTVVDAPLDAPALALAINALDDAPLAGVEDDRLTLSSRLEGGAGRIELVPISVTETRAFVSRVPIAEDAAMTVLGLLDAEAQAEPAEPAILQGEVNLSRGVDLRTREFVRVRLDDGLPIDIRCAGPRPRNTTQQEVVDAINGALGQDVAVVDGDTLRLVSPSSGSHSRITLEAPQATDAQPTLLGTGALIATGLAARQVSFVGTQDLSAGIDLTGASHLSLAVDGGPAEDIDCRGFDPAATTLDQIAVAINLKLGVNIASHDGRHVLLTSPTRGPDSSLEILSPASPDATLAILGVPPGRRYVGEAAQAARIEGLVPLTPGIDLSTARFLRIGLDTAAPQDIDCAGEAIDATAVTADEVVAAVNAALGADVARVEADRLVLLAPAPGASSRLVVQDATGGDAAPAIFGDTERDVAGTPAQPAKITGRVDLRRGSDLGTRSVLRLVIDDAQPVDIDLAGEAPNATSADEIVAAINAVLPDMASINAEGQLELVTPDGSRLSLVPLRYFELIDYPPDDVMQLHPGVEHGDAIFPVNSGAAEVLVSARFKASLGVDSPGLVDLENSLSLRLRGALEPEREAFIGESDHGLAVEVSDGLVPRVFGLPLLPHLDHPPDDRRTMAAGRLGRRGVLLSDAFGSDIVELTEIGRRDTAPTLHMQPAGSLPSNQPDGVFLGQIDLVGDQPFLDDGSDQLELSLPRLKGLTELVGQPVAVLAEPVGNTLIVKRLRALYDLRIQTQSTEQHVGVVLDNGGDFGPLSLVTRLNEGPDPSTIVFARVVDQHRALSLQTGTNRRVFMDCLSSRFDAAHFDQNRFAGGPCTEQGTFDASRFAETPAAKSTPVFAPVAGGTTTDVQLDWKQHMPGRAEINLPLDMPARFGARFDTDRFALPGDAPETIGGLVTEPATDVDLLTNRLAPGASESRLIEARATDSVPIGFEPVDIPFARLVSLTGGTGTQAARVFLSDPGLPGFIELAAKEAGTYGNHIAVAVCDTEPGIYDLLVVFDGARFENARALVNGPPLTGEVRDLNTPGPRGAQHLKAGGIDLVVTRDGTPPETPSH